MTSAAVLHLEELRYAAQVAWRNYRIWWTYKSSDTRPLYVDVMNSYLLFFSVSIHAHFVSFVVALYRLYETRPDTYNIPRLLDEMEQSGVLPSETRASLSGRAIALKPVWIKVAILRNNAFGHHSADSAVVDVFRSAKLTPNEVVQLLEGTRVLLNEIGRLLNVGDFEFPADPSTQVVAMLEALKLRSAAV